MGVRSEKREARATGSLRETGESGTGLARSSLDSTHDQRRAVGRAISPGAERAPKAQRELGQNSVLKHWYSIGRRPASL